MMRVKVVGERKNGDGGSEKAAAPGLGLGLGPRIGYIKDLRLKAS